MTTIPPTTLERLRLEKEKFCDKSYCAASEEYLACAFGFQAGALALAAILSEAPESGHPPHARFAKRRLYSDEGPNSVDCPVHWGEFLESVKPRFEEYVSVSELQSLRAADLLRIVELEKRVKAEFEERTRMQSVINRYEEEEYPHLSAERAARKAAEDELKELKFRFWLDK